MSAKEWTLEDLKRFSLRVAVSVIALAIALYVGDWAVWRVRAARGGGVSTVRVSRVVVAPLKGGKEEYYPDGSDELVCSQSLFPQTGGGACWWLRRQPVVFER